MLYNKYLQLVLFLYIIIGIMKPNVMFPFLSYIAFFFIQLNVFVYYRRFSEYVCFNISVIVLVYGILGCFVERL